VRRPRSFKGCRAGGGDVLELLDLISIPWKELWSRDSNHGLTFLLRCCTVLPYLPLCHHAWRWPTYHLPPSGKIFLYGESHFSFPLSRREESIFEVGSEVEPSLRFVLTRELGLYNYSLAATGWMLCLCDQHTETKPEASCTCVQCGVNTMKTLAFALPDRAEGTSIFILLLPMWFCFYGLGFSFSSAPSGSFRDSRATLKYVTDTYLL
jgi:hypothetical protein